MKHIVTFLFLFLGYSLFAQPQQDCEQIAKECNLYLSGQKGKETFISDGQVYRAFLDREKAEFKTTLYGRTEYRIAASAGKDGRFVIFSVKDLDGNILFTNAKYKNAPYWDFKVPATVQVNVEAELDKDLKSSGCAVLLIGFKRN